MAGSLAAGDLGRRERACAVCLTEQPARVAIELRAVTSIDPAARSFLDRMRARGAAVSGGPAAASPGDIPNPH
jgi:hypothetical protein